MATHALKTWPEFFERLLSGEKTFEVRKDDRGFQAGDTLILNEWVPISPTIGSAGNFTGRKLIFKVGYVFKQGFGLDLGQYVVMSLCK